MRVPRVFQDVELNQGAIIELNLEAFQHVIKVLRLQVKDNVIIFNGKGQQAQASISKLEKKTCWVTLNLVETTQPADFSLHLVQAIIKPDKMDLIIQKAVELGVSKITPVISKNCDIKLSPSVIEKKMHHWQKIIINACEQCGENYLPQLSEVETLTTHVTANKIQGIVLNPYTETKFDDLAKNLTEPQLKLLIGPEGGLTSDEIALTMKYNFIAINLGNRILRAETAAIASIVLAKFLFDYI